MRELKNGKIFLIDGLGAFFSALMLGAVLPWFSLGFPPQVLWVLAGLAGLLSVYSLSCSFFRKPLSPWLFWVAVFNFSYCLLTAGLLFWFLPQLTALAWIYFAGEILLICSLVVLELRIWHQNRRESQPQEGTR